MISPWQILAGNLAVVALFVLGWANARFWLRNWPTPLRRAMFGASMGLGAVASMSMAVSFHEGVYFDLRSTLLLTSAFFGGVPAALLTTAIAMVYRGLLGGMGIWSGLIGIILATGTGLMLRMIMRRHEHQPWHMVGLGIAAASVTVLAMAALPHETMLEALAAVGLPITVVNIAATTLAGIVFLQARRLSAEFDLVAAALSQSPDFAYVKDNRSRFAAVNNKVARLHGFDHPSAMTGMTDFDIATPERARLLLEREQAVLDSDEPLLDHEEHLPDEAGDWHWYSTSKIPLHNRAGEIIGIAGVTRDITLEKQLQQELTQSRDTLSFALSEMSDGLAMFDSAGFLVFCNEQYRAAFPYTGQARRPGAHMSEILRAVVETGEQATVPKDDIEAWIERIVGNLNRESEEEVALFDGRWLQVGTRPASNGATLVVVTDVTRIKQAELALHSATDELKELVRTDGLTGLLNRRAFDDAIDTEIRRSSRAAMPLSMLLIDVDRFKAYNDQYGHPAGDECLRQVGVQLTRSLKRPGDLAVRYGGEEFAAILPDTDEDGAYLVAEGFRRSLAELHLPHVGSERGYLTASVGVATYMPDNLHRSVAELVQAADEALYSAKAAGRDRVFGTRVAGARKRYASMP